MESGVSCLTRTNVDWQDYWTGFEAGETPTSMSLHPEFMQLVKREHAVLDVGCCSGRGARELAETTGCRVVGIDINDKELDFGRKLHIENGRQQRISYINANGVEIPFRNDSFHGAILLGILCGVPNKLRSSILAETVRVLKPLAPLYTSEFERIGEGDPKWDREYERGERATGERGSVVVFKKGSKDVSFIGYHFEEPQMSELLSQTGLSNVVTRRSKVVSTVSGNVYSNLCMWGVKGL